MALMPPRRSTRLSANEYATSSSSPLAYAKVTSAAGPSKARIDDGKKSTYGSSAAFTSARPAKATSSSSTGRRERRFEEIASDDDDDGMPDGDDEDANFMTGFARPVISGNVRHAASIPVPRAPRATYYEEAGDDGFIFSAAAPVVSSTGQGKRKSSTGIAGSRGPPPRSSSAQHARISSARQAGQSNNNNNNNRGDEIRQTHHSRDSSRTPPPAPMNQAGRVSSSAVKAVRRTSLLRDGSAAHPHPVIADSDLHRHCSSDMDRAERLRHMANWTLNRSTKKLMGRFSGSQEAQGVLHTVLQSTLQGLSSGDVQLTWPGLNSAEGTQHKRPHPRNEANRRTERTLVETVSSMQQEVQRWERCKGEIKSYEAETEELERRAAAEMQDVTTTDVDELRAFLDEEEGSDKELVREALVRETPWFGSSNEDPVCELATDLYAETYAQPAPQAKSIKRRRTTMSTAFEDDKSDADDVAPSLQGTQADPRWQDVEWNADLLRSRTHRITQFARLADRYTTAISARGAQAIDEMINGVGKDAAAGDSASAVPSSSSSSKVSRQGQETLRRILAGIRTVEGEAGMHADEDQEIVTGAVVKSGGHAVPGDISEGDILRAFAGLSGRPR